MNNAAERNYGIELFRIISMLMVLTLHITCHGGVMAEASTLRSHSYLITSFMAYFVRCCVDCFALISGFVGYQEEEKPFKYHKYVSFWLQAVFYGLLGRMAVQLFANNPGRIEYGGAFFPVITDDWWYFSAYTALFFLIPSINRLIRGLSSRQLHCTVLTLVVLFSLVETVSSNEPFRLDGGFSFLWLAITYVIGAWVKREKIHERLCHKKWAVLAFAFCEIIVSWIIVEKFGLSQLSSYTSPTILFFAWTLLIFFATVRIKQNSFRKLIRVFAPCAFGVYLMHNEKYIWFGLMKDAFRFVGHAPTLAIPVVVGGLAMACYLFASGIELIRMKLFSLAKVELLAKKAEYKIRERFAKHTTL